MTIPKEPYKYEQRYVSEKYAQLEEMYRLARKCYPTLMRLIGEEMGREELYQARERNRRILQQSLLGKKSISWFNKIFK